MTVSRQYRWVCLLATLALSPATWAGTPSNKDAKTSGLASRQLKANGGANLPLAAPRGGVLLLVFYSTECPISNSYSQTLNEIVRGIPEDKVRVVGLCVDPDKTEAEVASHAKEFQIAFPVSADRQGAIARKLGVKVTPEVAVLDDRDQVRYLGRIDDQFFDRGKRNAHPMSNDLKDAVGALLNGREVARPRVEAVGCPLPEAAAAIPTYNETVGGILRQHCQECHRPGQVGPFSLTSYEQARKRASDIATVVESRQMPPWKPSPHFGPKLKYDKSLSAEEIASVVSWAENGTPEGDKAAAPAPFVAPTGEWALGTPDLVIEPAEDFQIPATGKDIYRCFVIPTNLPQDMYVSAIEYKPGNRRVVHHVLSYVDISGKGRELDKADPGQGYECFSGPEVDVHGDLGGWAPGNEPTHLPDGIGRSFPKGCDAIVQVHYHPSGKPETDRTRIGLHFSKKPIRQILHWSAALNPTMALPPGDSKVAIQAGWVVPADVDAYAVTPHMHLLGKDMTMVLTDPEGKVTPLVKIDDWDFQWQNTYYFEKPLRVKKGSMLGVVAHYDNSAKNPRNPNNPPKEVKWGEATTDEMCIGFLAVTKVGQDLTKPGEVDDLGTIIKKSYREMEERMRKQGEAEYKKKMEAQKKAK